MLDNIFKEKEDIIVNVIFEYLQMGACEDEVHHLIYEYCIMNSISIEIPRLQELIQSALYVRNNREALLNAEI